MQLDEQLFSDVFGDKCLVPFIFSVTGNTYRKK